MVKARRTARDGYVFSGMGGMAFALRLAEPFVFILISWLAIMLREGVWVVPSGYVGLTLVGVLAYAFFGHMIAIYKARNIATMIVSIPRMVWALMGAVGFVIGILFLTKTSVEYSRIWLMTWFVGALSAFALMRIYVAHRVRTAITSGRWKRRVALLGLGPKTDEIIRILHDKSLPDTVLTGIYVVNTDDTMAHPVATKGNLKTLLQDGRRQAFDHLIITVDLDRVMHAEELFRKIRNLNVTVHYCLPRPLFGLAPGADAAWGGTPLVTLMRPPMEGHNLLLKRCLDIAVALVGMVPFSLLFIVIAPLVKLSSPGPVFFKQKRRGLNGEAFEMLKFRSMRAGPAPLDQDGKEKQATQDDPRITAIGRFIRKTSLDETPQVLNVLKGDMSLIGPRPHAMSHDTYYEQLIDSYTSRHKMRPGITGWAQLNGLRGETDTLDKMERRIEYDVWYIENWSLGLDLKILFLTPLVVLFQKQAY